METTDTDIQDTTDGTANSVLRQWTLEWLQMLVEESKRAVDDDGDTVLV